VSEPTALPDALANLAGATHAKALQTHLRHLRGAYAHGNRTLFYDELVTTYLLAFFDPTLRSLRAIQDFTSDEAHLHPRKLCRSTISDANALMDARLLEPIIAHLQARVHDLRRTDGQLDRLLRDVQLVDGSFFAAAADVAWALRKPRGPSRQARLDLRLDAATMLPVTLHVSGTGQSESARAAERVEPGAIYVADRGFQSLAYACAVLDGGADFVLRAKDDLNFDVREELKLDPDDVAAGVLSDRLGRLVGSPHARAAKLVPGQELREVRVSDPDHPGEPPLRLITSLLDPPARVIAQLYRRRWQIELFFRWLKVHAHFRHLISRSRNGMTMGFHVAVIAVLLMYLRTGRPMSKYAFNLLAYVADGRTTLENVLPILERRERECARDRQRQQARRAAKNRA
jgi:DDE family transposase